MFDWSGRDTDPPFACPRCGHDRPREVWRLPQPMILHWVLNPGLVVNELVLGQRVPARLYHCGGCPAQSVACPTCRTHHDAMIWSGRHGFGHWLGLICPDCGGRIPSLLNVTSWLILWRLSPVFVVLWWLTGGRYVEAARRRAELARDRLAATGTAGYSGRSSGA